MTQSHPSLEAVLGLSVPAQIHLALEALGTELAAEGFEAGVFAAVGDQVGALAEGFATHLAFVRLLPCRAQKMAKKIPILTGEGLGLEMDFGRVRPAWASGCCQPSSAGDVSGL